MCLMAKQILAQEGEQQEETTQGGEQQQETPSPQATLIDQVLDALKNPGAEHINIYAGLGFVVLVIVLVATQMSKEKEDDPEATLTLGELVKDPMQQESDEKAKYHKDIDANGPYPTEVSGELTPDALVKLRHVICKQAYTKFMPRKHELMEERLGYFKQQDMQNYVQCIQKSAQDYEAMMKESTLEALKLLDISEKNYEASFLKARSNPEVLQRLQKTEEGIRLEVEPKREILESKEQLKKIMMDKIRMDFDCEMKLAGMQVSSQAEAQQRIMIERTKVMDQIYLTYKLKLADLMRSADQYELDDDPDVKALKASNMAVKQKAREKIEAAQKLTPEQEKRVVDEVEKAGPLQPLNDHNVLHFEDHVKIQSIISRLGIDIMNAKHVAFKTERRQFLEEKKEAEYQKCIQMFQQQQKIVFAGVTKSTLAAYKIAMPVFQESTKHYMTNPEFAEKLNKSQQQIVTESQNAVTSHEELSREEVLKYMQQIEEEKVDSMAQIQIAISARKVPPQLAPTLMEVHKIKAFDKLFKETGVEEEDITKAFIQYKLSEAPEFKEMMAKTKTQIQEKIKEFMEKAKAAQAARGPGGF